MSVTLPPSGTRGFVMPKLAQPLAKAGMSVSHLVFRMLGDRMKVQGHPLLLLTTVGAKTGKKRQAVLGRFADPDHPGAWLIVGSGAGSQRHPSWCYNLAKNPDEVWVKVGKDHLKVQPQSLSGAEREKAWAWIVSKAKGYKRYETTTDREIPIIRLTPERVLA
jgi:deazaflavin-dependent oxidoreductase (nitroreductase family)